MKIFSRTCEAWRVYIKKRNFFYANDMPQANTRRQGRIWILTMPAHSWGPPLLPVACSWIRGQLERGDGGYLHWQVVVYFKSKASLRAVKGSFPEETHGELTRGPEAEEYVWKEDTRVEGTQFELGVKPFDRSSGVDWERVWELAKTGDLLGIPAQIRVSSYSSLRRIRSDHAVATAMERVCNVYWGDTGTGKSHRAWSEAGMGAYPKNPTTKFWDGYLEHTNVVIDEFRGGISISHLLRWLDKYPVFVETKGGQVPLSANCIWITSNLEPSAWYPELDTETTAALLRRLNVVHFRAGLTRDFS